MNSLAWSFVLRLYPRRFRERWGDELRRVAEETVHAVREVPAVLEHQRHEGVAGLHEAGLRLALVDRLDHADFGDAGIAAPALGDRLLEARRGVNVNAKVGWSEAKSTRCCRCRVPRCILR